MGIPDMNNKKIKHCIKHNKVKAICSYLLPPRLGCQTIYNKLNYLALRLAISEFSSRKGRGNKNIYTR